MPVARSGNKYLLPLRQLVALCIGLILAAGLQNLIYHPIVVTPVEEVPTIIPASTKEISRGDTSKRQLIFTFDGGGPDVSTGAILAALAKHHVQGTFFLTGKFIEAHPDTVRNIAAAGHEIFSHTYSHPHLTALTNDEIVTELAGLENALLDTIGRSARPYFRPPYGDRDERVRDVAAAVGYQSVYWTLDALDWQEKSGRTADEVENRILSNMAPGNIYLMHLGDTITGDILDDVFTAAEQKGYKLVSLTQGI